MHARGWTIAILAVLAGPVCWSARASLPVDLAPKRDVAIVLSQELAPSREALRGIEEILGSADRVLDLASEAEGAAGIARLELAPPEAIIAIGARAAHLVTERLRDVPTVYCLVLESEAARLAGHRVTGVAIDVPVARQLASFRDLVPHLARVAVLYDPTRSKALVDRARTAAASSGIALVTQAVVSPEDVPAAFRRAARDVDGVWLIPDSTVVNRGSFEFILHATAERRLPLMVFSEPMVRAGGLVAVVPDHTDVGRQAAELVVRLLGARRRRVPPVEAPRALRLVLNAKTADMLGVAIPVELAARAGTHVYR
jgi:putative tryptophan/tyrosine transport system substrate-binding protein